MANVLITPQLIARRALAQLFNASVLASLVYRDFDPDFTGKQGDTVNVRRPAVLSALTFSRASGITLQDVLESSVPVQLSTLVDVSFPVTTEDLTLKIDDFAGRLLTPAMEAIVQRVDGDLAAALLGAATAGGPTYAITGVASTDVITVPGASANAPHNFRNGDRVWFPALTGGTGLTAGTTDYYVIGATATTFQVSLTPGGAAVNFTTDITAGTVADAGGGTAVRTGGGGASSTLVNARTKLTTNKLALPERYAVLGPAAAGLALQDPLFAQANTSGSTDALRQGSVGAAFGFDTYESQVFTGTNQGAAFHREAVALASRTLQAPNGVAAEQVSVAGYKGLGLRVVQAYDINKKQDVVSIDFLYGIKTLRAGGAVQLTLT